MGGICGLCRGIWGLSVGSGLRSFFGVEWFRGSGSRVLGLDLMFEGLGYLW